MAQQAKVTTISTAFGTVCLMRDATLGTGAYGQVCRATLAGKPCAAKLLHPILVDPSNPRNLTKFEQECRLLSEIRHPNIVQYLGVARDGETGLPVLLMELMDDSLTHFLEQSEEPLAYHVQVNISYDIALAVAFLHSKRIIHRDLSSNNVLLSDDGSRAKVTDFGMSKLDSHMTGLTKCPGTPAYMAPEALLDPPVYTEKLDCFQLGVLMIQTITRKFPDPGPAMNRVRDARYPTGWTNAPVPEVKRRQNHLNLVPQTHLMLCIAMDCLKDTDSERPSAQQICGDLSALKEVSQYGQSLLKESEQLIQQLRRENQEKIAEITKKEREGRKKDREIENLKRQLQQKEIGEMKRNMRMEIGRQVHKYYDILLLGRTGKGKSTTANRLLGIQEHSRVSETQLKLWGQVEEGVAKFFETGSGMQSVTEKCKLISHQRTTIRVLDTPAFVIPKLTEELMKSNLHIFRSILEESRKFDLAFRRVLYFLPTRGTPERADGSLQNEIKVMYDYLGQNIFNIMVIIATNVPKPRHQRLGFEDEDTEKVKEVFTLAYETITGSTLPQCPPVLYIPYAPDPELLDKVLNSRVLHSGPLKCVTEE